MSLFELKRTVENMPFRPDVDLKKWRDETLRQISRVIELAESQTKTTQDIMFLSGYAKRANGVRWVPYALLLERNEQGRPREKGRRGRPE